MKAVLFDMDGVLIDSEMFYMKGTYDWISKRVLKENSKILLDLSVRIWKEHIICCMKCSIKNIQFLR